MIELTLRDIGILSTLNEASGFPTKHIAKAVEPTAYATRKAFARSVTPNGLSKDTTCHA